MSITGIELKINNTKADQALQKTKEKMMGLGKGSKETGNQVKSTGTRFTEMASKLTLLRTGLTLAVTAFKKIGEIAEERANLFSQFGGDLQLGMAKLSQYSAAVDYMIDAQTLMRSSNLLVKGDLKLTEHQFESVAKAAIQFSRATGEGADVVLKRLTDTINSGSSRGLRQYGIIIEDSGSKTEKTAKMVAELEKRFGSLSIVAGDAAEKMAKYKNETKQLAYEVAESTEIVSTWYQGLKKDAAEGALIFMSAVTGKALDTRRRANKLAEDSFEKIGKSQQKALDIVTEYGEMLAKYSIVLYEYRNRVGAATLMVEESRKAKESLTKSIKELDRQQQILLGNIRKLDKGTEDYHNQVLYLQAALWETRREIRYQKKLLGEYGKEWDKLSVGLDNAKNKLQEFALGVFGNFKKLTDPITAGLKKTAAEAKKRESQAKKAEKVKTPLERDLDALNAMAGGMAEYQRQLNVSTATQQRINNLNEESRAVLKNKIELNELTFVQQEEYKKLKQELIKLSKEDVQDIENIENIEKRMIEIQKLSVGLAEKKKRETQLELDRTRAVRQEMERQHKVDNKLLYQGQVSDQEYTLKLQLLEIERKKAINEADLESLRILNEKITKHKQQGENLGEISLKMKEYAKSSFGLTTSLQTGFNQTFQALAMTRSELEKSGKTRSEFMKQIAKDQLKTLGQLNWAEGGTNLAKAIAAAAIGSPSAAGLFKSSLTHFAVATALGFGSRLFSGAGSGNEKKENAAPATQVSNNTTQATTTVYNFTNSMLLQNPDELVRQTRKMNQSYNERQGV